MDDMKTILASEGVKSLLQTEIKKPIRFIEDSLNVLKAAFREELKRSKEVNIELKKETDLLRSDFKYLREANAELNSQLAICKEELKSATPRDWAENELRKNNERIVKVLSDAVEYRKMNDKRARLNQGSLLDLEEKQKIFELDIEIVKDTLESGRKDLNKMRASEAEYRSEKEEFLECFLVESRHLLELNRLQVSDQNNKIERIDGTVKKSDKRIKQDSVDLSKNLLEQFSKFESDFDKRMADLKYKRKNIYDEVERLEQLIMKSMQAGKSSKELEDFMKQVSYNARQIARIQQSLEGE